MRKDEPVPYSDVFTPVLNASKLCAAPAEAFRILRLILVLQMMQILHLINRLTQHLAHAAAATVGWMLLSLTSFRSRSTSMFARVVVAPCA